MPLERTKGKIQQDEGVFWGEPAPKQVPPSAKKTLIATIASLSALFVFGLIFTLNYLYPTGISHAATVTWVGGASSTWHTASNWSTGSVPTSADDVTLSSSTAFTVTLWAGQTASFNSLTIGGGTATTTMVLIGNVGTGGSLTVERQGKLQQQNAVAQTLSSTLTVKGLMTHASNTSAQAFTIDFAAQTIDLQTGGWIDVAGKGYAGQASNAGLGPGKGSGGGGSYSSGGGHGGQGGDSLFNGYAGGVSYCDITNVNTIGSSGGGGFSTGGSGGGLVRLVATGTATISGSILANGGTAPTGNISTAAGAGGGIKISADTVAGTPTSINLSGGSAGVGTSGGGGGCMQIAYTTSNSITSSLVTLGGGSSGSGNGGYVGGAGVLYVKQASATYGDLYSNSTFTSDYATTTLSNQNLTLNSLSLSRSKFVVTSTQRLTLSNGGLAPFAGSSTTTPGTLFVQGTVDLGGAGNLAAMNVIVHGGTLVNPAALTVGVNGALKFFGSNTMTAITSVSSSGQLYLTRGSFSSSNMSLVMNSGATTTMAGYVTTTAALALSDVTINNNALLTHQANLSTQSNVINIAANNFTINSGGSINVDGKGYARYAGCYGNGYGPGGGVGNSFVGQGAGGGGHGGAGGSGNSGNAGGAAYCLGSNVSTIGSAGGDGSACASDAGAGGGLVVLNVTSTITINGTISAKGVGVTGTSNSGSGAGGGVKIAAGTVAGTPTLFSVAGGDTASSQRGGNGGGGCVSIAYGSGGTTITSANMSYAGGSTGGGTEGGAGGTGLVSVSSTLPTAPSTLYVANTDASTGSANPTNLTTLTPVFSALCGTPNSDTCTSAAIEVDDNSDFSSPTWQSGQTSITAIASSTRSQNITYAGTTLKYNTTYYWRIKMYNAYGAGAWSDGTATLYVPRTIELYSFDLGGTVQSGKSIPVTWGSIGGSTTTAETVKIQYSNDGFVSAVSTVTSSVSSASSSSTLYSYSWTIPSATTVCGASSCSGVKIRISSNNDGNNYAITSAQSFTIQNSSASGIKYSRTFSASDFYTSSNATVSYSAGSASIASQASWTKRKAITVTNNTASTLTNFEVSIPVTYDADMQADFDDIRFTSSDGSTFINYWLETKTDSTSATFWVQVPSIAASSAATIYMYYGNASAATISSATSTFLFADDFSTTLDTSKWTTVGSPSNSSGILNLSSSNYGIWATSYTLPGSVVMESYISKSISTIGAMGAVTASGRFQGELTTAGWGFDYLFYGGSIYGEVGAAETAFSSWASSAYRRQKIVYVSGSSVKVYDNAANTTFSSSIPAASGGFHPEIYNNSGTLSADWIFVRQYASTDPSVSTGSEESTFLLGSGGTTSDYTVDFMAGHTFTTASSFTASTTGAVRFQLSNDDGSTWKYCAAGTLTSASASVSYTSWASEVTNACLASLSPGTLRVRTYISTPTSTAASTIDYLGITLANTTNNAPIAPTSSVAVSATSMTYSWTSGGGDETYYAVEKSTDGTTFSSVATTTGTNYTFTGLATNTAYWFRVAGADGVAATSSYTTSSPAYTLPNTPNAPSLVSSVSATTLFITINDTTINSNLTASTTFIVKDTGSVSPVYLQTDLTWGASAVALTYTQLGSGAGITTTGLTANTPHTISVAAVNPDGATTSYGTSLSAYTLANAPGTPSMSGATTSTMQITISTNSNPASTEFAIYNSTAGNYISASGISNGSTAVWQTRAVWGSGFTVRGLTSDSTYQFYVIARNGDGIQTANSSLSTALATYGINNPTLSPVTSAVTRSSVRLDWTSGGGDETYFTLDQSTNGTDYTNITTTGTSTTYYTFTGLSANTQYWFRVASGDGVSDNSSYVAATPVYTLANTPNAPSVVTSTATTTLSVTIDATTINGNPQTVNTTYIVRDTAGDTTRYLQNDATWGTSSTAFTYSALGSGAALVTTGLTANTPHTISVSAINGDGVATSYGTSRSSYTLTSVPSSVQLSISADNIASLSWQGDATEYYVTGNQTSDWNSNASAVFNSLVCDTEYSFRVKARNGNSVETAYTDSVSGRTGPCGGWSAWRAPQVTLESPSLTTDTTQTQQPTDAAQQSSQTEFVVKTEVTPDVGVPSLITIGSETHSLVVNSVSPTSITITLHSEPLTATLQLNQPQDFDTDGDGINDTRGVYTGLVDGKPNIVFTPIFLVKIDPLSTSINVRLTTSTAPANSTTQEGYVFSRTLKRGSVGDDVIELQKRLKEAGYFPAAVDYAPSFGSITEFALRTYQRASRLTETGQLNEQTRQLLNQKRYSVSPLSISDRYFFTQTVRRGSVGLEVLQLQTLLQELGFFPKNTQTTRFFGIITDASLGKFQTEKQIEGEKDARGTFTGPKTREQLNAQE